MRNCRTLAVRVVALLAPGILACGGASSAATTMDGSTGAAPTTSTGAEAGTSTTPTSTMAGTTDEPIPTTGGPKPDLPIGGECDLFA